MDEDMYKALVTLRTAVMVLGVYAQQLALRNPEAVATGKAFHDMMVEVSAHLDAAKPKSAGH